MGRQRPARCCCACSTNAAVASMPKVSMSCCCNASTSQPSPQPASIVLVGLNARMTSRKAWLVTRKRLAVERHPRTGFHEIRALKSWLHKKAGHDQKLIQILMVHTSEGMTSLYQAGHETIWHEVNLVLSDDLLKCP